MSFEKSFRAALEGKPPTTRQIVPRIIGVLIARVVIGGAYGLGFFGVGRLLGVV